MNMKILTAKFVIVCPSLTTTIMFLTILVKSVIRIKVS